MDIPIHLQGKVDRELDPDERVKWTEMPVPRAFTPAVTGVFVFGIPWTLAAVLITCDAAGIGLPGPNQDPEGVRVLPLLFGLPFIVVGLLLLSAPIFAYRRVFQTVYVITDRRAIAIEGTRTTTIRSYTAADLQHVYPKERRDGYGDVVIPLPPLDDYDANTRTEDRGFLGIRDPKKVERLLKELAEPVIPEGRR